MTTVERIISLCKAKRIPIYRLENDLGFSNGYIRQLKKVPDDRLKLIADYIGESVEYLITGEKKDEPTSGDELIEILDACRDRTDLRTLFKLTKDASPGEVNKVIGIIRALRND